LCDPYSRVDRRPKGEHAVNVAVMKEENRIKSWRKLRSDIIQKLLETRLVTSILGVAHVTPDGAVNFIVYRFQRVTRATTIAHRVVAKSRPSANTRKEVVDFLGKIALYGLQIAGGKSE
jgi:hypothetical protein